MTITTVQELRGAVTDELLRAGDATFAARLPRLIAQAERAIERDLRCKEMEKTTTLTLSAGQAQPTGGMPADLLEVVAADLLTPPATPLAAMERSALVAQFSGAPQARPRAFSEFGGALTFAPTPDATYQVRLDYIARLAPLTDAAPTNAVFARYWDLYLYATLLASAPGLADDARIKVWGELYGAGLQGAMDQINASNVRSAYSRATAGRQYGKLS